MENVPEKKRFSVGGMQSTIMQKNNLPGYIQTVELKNTQYLTLIFLIQYFMMWSVFLPSNYYKLIS